MFPTERPRYRTFHSYERPGIRCLLHLVVYANRRAVQLKFSSENYTIIKNNIRVFYPRQEGCKSFH